MKHFTSAWDVRSVNELIDLACFLKENPHAFNSAGKNQTLGMVFMNPSLRTRLSTIKAAQLIGMNTLQINAQHEGWTLDFSDNPMNGTTVENIREAAAVLGEYCDILAVRSFPSLLDKAADDSEINIRKWIEHSKKPFISLESATRHPLQSLADMVTIKQLFPHKKPKVVLTWAPHIKPVPHAVANSFCEWMYFMNADFAVACPDQVKLNEEFTSHACVTSDQDEALRNADIVYVKSWASYENYGELHSDSSDWLLTPEKLRITNNAKVMHCLPVRRDVELASAILDSPASVVTQQAANRIPAAQAVLLHLLKDNYLPQLSLNCSTSLTGVI